VRPKLSGRSVRVVSANGIDPLIIIGEPVDEIAEAWQDFSSLALVWICLNALVLSLLNVVLGRVLDPLASVARGMQSLKGGRYTMRIKPPRVKELTLITERFNGLAGNLASAREENSRLYRQLISTQEQVRREIANELHDEAGACLFGIAANASSIRMIVNDLAGVPAAKIRGYAGTILGAADRLKAMNRAILKQLRPGPLGQVRLSNTIEELVAGLQRNHRGTQVILTLGDLAKSYGEGIDLTIYRCIQEGVTTAIRSSKSKTISVGISEHSRSVRKGSRSVLRFSLIFESTTFLSSKTKDIALAVMVERVRSIGGDYKMQRVASRNISIRVDIPIRQTSARSSMVS
jgi:two-component system sensor histidine kinase UhpB